MNSSVSGLKEELEGIRKKEKCSIEGAFLRWFIYHNFERDCKFVITDGNRDGGIDGILQRHSRKPQAIVLQSKYCDSIFKNKTPSPLGVPSYTDFDSLPDIFASDSKMKEYLKTVDSSLRHTYKDLSEKVQGNWDIRWLFTTLHTRSRSGENRLRNVSPSDFSYAADNIFLYDLSLEGAEPPAEPMTLNFSESFTVEDQKLGVRTYVLKVQANDFVNYVDSDPNFRILARNVRSDLRSDINASIRETFDDYPEEFWYSHNGIIIICQKATIIGKSIRLIAPSIINGAQTIFSLRGACKRSPKAFVLTRVIEMPSAREKESDTQSLLRKIIFRTNQQNRMFVYDLRANDPVQVKLAKEFLERRVFYERKRGQWKLNQRQLKNQGFKRLRMTKLAQILCSCDDHVGGVPMAMSTAEKIFKDKTYDSIFLPDFEEAFFKYKLNQYLTDCVWNSYDKRSSSWTEAKQMIFTCLALSWKTLESEPRLRLWKELILKDPQKLAIDNEDCDGLHDIYTQVFKALWNQYRLEREKEVGLTAKNYFRNETVTQRLIKKYSEKYGKPIVKSFSKSLKTEIV